MKFLTIILLKTLLFFTFSFLQVTYAEATDFVIPSEDPDECLKNLEKPCSFATGDTPKFISWENIQWEIDRYSVAQFNDDSQWVVYQGMAVVNSQKPLKVHTPFADIHIGKSKVLIHVLENKVRVMSLKGEGIKVIPKLEKDEQFLIPGFQNWFAGVGPSGQEYGVPTVIDFRNYAKARAKFFMDHKLGFVKELEQVAGVVKWATYLASQMHRDLHDRKVASLEQKHQQKVFQKKQGIRFNKYLRQLFLKKVRYDY